MKDKHLIELLEEMTLAEKVGQLVQLTPDFFAQGGEITGPMQQWQMSEAQSYQIGSVLGTHTAEQVYTIQKQYLEKSRLKIPLVFMADVIHGYETIFPIPLAMAASFDEHLIEKAAKLAAKEAAEAGIHVTFSPMADYVKDARWGRVLESNGEDPTLSSVLTAAYVRGYQGATNNLNKDKKRIAACVKHFVGYGAAEGGRDYNTVDLSDLEIYQNYLPAFKAAIDAGAALVMTSFNTVRGIPATANQPLIQDVLRKQLGFEGLVISDWAAVAELIAHRVAADGEEAAKKAFHAGIEMDMMSDCYMNSLAQIITAAPELQQQLDQAVYHVLKLKDRLGLFDDPYRGLNEADLSVHLDTDTRLSTREAAEKTAVLLKNEDILPLSKNQKIALIGPKADSKDILGAWSWIGKQEDAVSLKEGLSEKNLDLSVLACAEEEVLSTQYIEKACKLAEQSDVVLLAVGESSEESGEAASLTKLTLSRRQDVLVQEIAKHNPNVVLILFNGRPLVLSDIEEACKAILIGWFPGSEGGHALANLLTGTVEPQGRLPMSFPRSVGQLPLTYGQLSTGRPKTTDNQDQKYISRYMDEENDALYPFGFGLGYSSCAIEKTTITIISKEEGLYEVSARLSNNSEKAHRTVLQLYTQDLVTEVARPMRELKQWQNVLIPEKSSIEVTFSIEQEQFAYVHSDLLLKNDPGKIALYIGFDSKQADKIGEIAI